MQIHDFMLNVALAALAPLLTAFAAALTFLVRDWHLRRNAKGRKTRAIEQATKQVEFIDVWLSAYSRSPTPDQQNDSLVSRARRDLEQAYQAVTAAAAEPTLERQGLRRTTQTIFHRSVQSVSGKAARSFYYAALVLLTLLMVMVVGVAADLLREGEFGAGISLVVLGIVVFIAPAVLLWHATAYLERRALRSTATAQSPV